MDLRPGQPPSPPPDEPPKAIAFTITHSQGPLGPNPDKDIKQSTYASIKYVSDGLHTLAHAIDRAIIHERLPGSRPVVIVAEIAKSLGISNEHFLSLRMAHSYTGTHPVHPSDYGRLNCHQH